MAAILNSIGDDRIYECVCICGKMSKYCNNNIYIFFFIISITRIYNNIIINTFCAVNCLLYPHDRIRTDNEI